MTTWGLVDLPFNIDLETKKVLKALPAAHAALAELKGLITKTGLLTNKSILQIQEVLEDNKAGFRKLPGTALKNAATGETVYTPPQDYEEITRLMANLENYINDPELHDCDP